MTYSNLDTIPYKLFVKIAETGDVSLLSDTDTDLAKLIQIWDKIYDEHLSKNQTSESKKILKLSKEVDSLLALYHLVIGCCHVLRFELNDDVLQLLKSYRYNISTETTEAYYASIDQIERESNAYIIKAENYRNMLPEKKEGEKTDYNVDDVMASYSSILGFSIGDFNQVTYNAFFGYEKQVNAKINALKQ